MTREDEPAEVVDLARRRVIGDPRLSQLALEGLLARRERARKDPGAFFEFVMREETTGARMQLAPHQQVVLDFVAAHDFAVVILPVDMAKTWMMAALTLWLLGKDPTTRGAIVSATEAQAQKVLRLVSNYVRNAGRGELGLVFPKLQPGLHDPWTQSAIYVDRPFHHVRDASLAAYGYDSKRLPGSRLDWVVVDDLVVPDNSATEEARAKLSSWFDGELKTRVRNGRMVLTNTPRHPRDLLARLQREGRATLRMDIMGGVRVQDDEERLRRGHAPWTHRELKPAIAGAPSAGYRLKARGDDEPLWPERWPLAKIEELRRTTLPHEFNQTRMCVARSDDESMCKESWVEACKEKARSIGYHHLVDSYAGPNLVFMGVDLAFRQHEAADYTAFFVFEQLPDGHRRVLDVEYGRWDSPTIVNKLIAKQRAFSSPLAKTGCVVRVENNACFHPATNVLTRRGYVPIDSVRKGDEVWTHRNRWRPVTEVLQGESIMLMPLRTRGGVGVRCTTNHWFYLREAGRTPGRGGGHYRPVGEARWASAGYIHEKAYAALAIPRWPDAEPVLNLRATMRMGTVREPSRRIVVDEEVAFVLGLIMAEGHVSKCQVALTLGWLEGHLASFVRRVIRKKLGLYAGILRRESTIQVTVSSVALADALRGVGKKSWKTLPLEWLGWPLETRLAIVRGWLAGDGCLLWNNAGTRWPRRHFSASSISRNWMLWARTTLFESGFRPALGLGSARRHSVIEGRTVARQPIYTLTLNAEDSFELRQMMTLEVEGSHWEKIKRSGRRSNGTIVLDGEHAWSAVGPTSVGQVKHYRGQVYNLVVDEDESFVVEDMVVHNAQQSIVDFARLQGGVGFPIYEHVTGNNKADPQIGIQSVFQDFYTGAWLVPNDKAGRCHPMVQRWLQACLDYTPTRHADDGCMAAWFCREQARAWGVLGDVTKLPPAQAAVGMGLLQR